VVSDEKRPYELHKGVIVETTTTGNREEVIGVLLLELNAEFKRLKLPYFTPQTYFTRPPESASGYQPDVIVLNKFALNGTYPAPFESCISNPHQWGART